MTRNGIAVKQCVCWTVQGLFSPPSLLLKPVLLFRDCFGDLFLKNHNQRMQYVLSYIYKQIFCVSAVCCVLLLGLAMASVRFQLSWGPVCVSRNKQLGNKGEIAVIWNSIFWSCSDTLNAQEFLDQLIKMWNTFWYIKSSYISKLLVDFLVCWIAAC